MKWPRVKYFQLLIETIKQYCWYAIELRKNFEERCIETVSRQGGWWKVMKWRQEATYEVLQYVKIAVKNIGSRCNNRSIHNTPFSDFHFLSSMMP